MYFKPTQYIARTWNAEMDIKIHFYVIKPDVKSACKCVNNCHFSHAFIFVLENIITFHKNMLCQHVMEYVL